MQAAMALRDLEFEMPLLSGAARAEAEASYRRWLDWLDEQVRRGRRELSGPPVGEGDPLPEND